MNLKRCYVAEASIAAHEGNINKSFGIFREGLNFYAQLCSEFISSVPTADRGFVMNCMTQLIETNRKHDPDSAEIERFIGESFQSIAVVIPGRGDDEDG